MSTYEYINHLTPPSGKMIQGVGKDIIPGYTLKSVIGSGAFANVYLAVDNKTEEKVAIKIPKIQGTFGEDTLRKFKSESDIWRPLAHENIVRFIRNGKAPLPYIVMEYMEGGNLRDLLNNHELSIAEGKHLMIQILSGLSYAHRMATIHRDIKPENILFTSGGVAKLTDWGIGRFMASTKVTETLGLSKTISYSAPEQSDPRKYGKVDWQTDIFQIGILFYEMLTGENPIYSDYDAGIINNLLHAEIPPPSSLNAEISLQLDNIVMTALARKKEDRWRSGDVMLNELDRAIRGKVIPSGAKTNLREYRTTLRGTLLDGKITRNEAKNLKKERERLGISEEDHNRLEKGLRKELGFEEKKTTPKDDIKVSFEELKKLYGRCKNLGLDVSPFRGRYNKIRGWIRFRKYNKAEDLLPALFVEMEDKAGAYEEELRERINGHITDVDSLVDECLERGLNVDEESDRYHNGRSEFEAGKLKDAYGIFEGLAKDLRSKADEADKEKRKRRELLAEFKELSRNKLDIPPPPGLERKIKDSPFDAEGDLAEYRQKIEGGLEFRCSECDCLVSQRDNECSNCGAIFEEAATFRGKTYEVGSISSRRVREKTHIVKYGVQGEILKIPVWKIHKWSKDSNLMVQNIDRKDTLSIMEELGGSDLNVAGKKIGVSDYEETLQTGKTIGIYTIDQWFKSKYENGYQAKLSLEQLEKVKRIVKKRPFPIVTLADELKLCLWRVHNWSKVEYLPVSNIKREDTISIMQYLGGSNYNVIGKQVAVSNYFKEILPGATIGIYTIEKWQKSPKSDGFNAELVLDVVARINQVIREKPFPQITVLKEKCQ